MQAGTTSQRVSTEILMLSQATPSVSACIMILKVLTTEMPDTQIDRMLEYIRLMNVIYIFLTMIL
jgi:hypothetical protein